MGEPKGPEKPKGPQGPWGLSSRRGIVPMEKPRTAVEGIESYSKRQINDQIGVVNSIIKREEDMTLEEIREQDEKISGEIRAKDYTNAYRLTSITPDIAQDLVDGIEEGNGIMLSYLRIMSLDVLKILVKNEIALHLPNLSVPPAEMDAFMNILSEYKGFLNLNSKLTAELAKRRTKNQS